MATATKLPDTKPYRVAQAGVIYYKSAVRTGLDGGDEIVATPVLATFGQEIDLTEREVNRLARVADDHAAAFGLKSFALVKAQDEPLSYDEMDDARLDELVVDRGIEVTSSGADDEQPLRADKINALVTYDQGQADAASE